MSAVSTIFIGSNGIRAGWRIMVFFAIVLAAAVALVVVFGIADIVVHGGVKRSSLAFLTHRDANLGVPGPWATAGAEGASLAALLFGAWVMSRVEHRRMGVYGLPLRRAFGAEFWHGAALGLGTLSAAMLMLSAAGAFHVNGLRETGPLLLIDAIAWAVAFVLVGLSEEFLFRGYVFFTLVCGTRFWLAAAITSFIFGILHASNPGETPAGLTGVVIAGFFASLLLWRTGNLWLGVGFHAAWDWSQTYVFGTADSGTTTTHCLLASSISGPGWLSGGTAGPEGSIAALIALALASVYVCYRVPRHDLAPRPNAGS